MTRIAAIATQPAATVRAEGTRSATFRARVGGYVVDMVIFAAIAMVFLVIAGIELLVATNGAERDATDAQFYTFLGIVGLGTPLVWTLINVLLLRIRGQTGGQYVAGVRVEREDGGAVTAGNALGWWFALNPLLFSWPMILVAAGPLAAIAAIVLDWWNIFLFGFVVLLCAVAPVVAFISAAMDGGNRALHDRVAGVIVRRVD